VRVHRTSSTLKGHSFEFLIGALRWATGETVAVKEIRLSNIPKGDLGEIMVSDKYWRWFGMLTFVVRD